jgi:serine/threonine-protein kinase
MGEVYLAEDSRLGRKVALKLLPARFTQDEDRLRRFAQEARAASALNHPNIITIHEIGQVDSVHFIATEFIDGQTLRERMAGEGMKLGEVLDVATQVASALAAAHEAGVLHRDIKPENIMLRCDGYVKVLDFGLAKLIEKAPVEHTTIGDSKASAEGQIRTDPGTVMGTPQYMSPEQVRGEKLDARSDIFSLGVVLYEMIAGRAPFAGASVAEVIATVLDREPAPLARYAGEVPEALEWAVTKALRKDREQRYQVVKDLLLDLKRIKQRLEYEAEQRRSVAPEVSRGAAVSMSGEQERVKTPQGPAARTGEIEGARPTSNAKYLLNEIKRHQRGAIIALAVVALAAAAAYFYLAGSRKTAIDSIAVLPFVNASADPDTEYLSDGITESLINSLSQLPNMKMIARSSVFRYKGREMDPRVIGRELGVRAVLMGRVMQRGDKLLVSAELVDVRDSRHLWGEQYNRRLSDIFVVQGEISREISRRLRPKLTSEEQRQLTKRYTENAEVYQLYLKGRYFWNKRTAEGLKKGIEYFEQAIATDPTYALAYAGLADCYAVLSYYSGIPPKQSFPRAKAAAMKVLEIEEALAEAHTSLGYVKAVYDWDWLGAERDFKRAIELNPSYSTAHHWYGLYLTMLGRFDEATAELKRAQELDPLSLIIQGNAAYPFYSSRQYDRAIEQYRRTLELDPDFGEAHFGLGMSYEQQGRYEEAIAEFKQAISLSPNDFDYLTALGHTYAASGRRSEAQKILEELKELSKQRYVSAYNMAVIHAGLGQKDQAFAWLEKAYEEHSSWMWVIKVEPRLDNLRPDPRFAALVRRVGLAP